MKDYIAQFIRDHESDIDTNNWIKVYTSAASHFSLIDDISALTNIFLEAGINPAEHMELLPRFYLAATDITEYVVPETIKVIYDEAFLYCKNLHSIIIPTSVKMIGSEAFKGCESLTFVQYLGTMEQWLKIQAKGAFEDLLPITVLCVKDGNLLQFK